MKKILFSSLFALLTCFILHSQTAYLDPSFGTGGVQVISDSALDSHFAFCNMALLPDGKILIKEVINTGASSTNLGVVWVKRFKADGSPDTGFGQNGAVYLGVCNVVNERNSGLVVTADNAILTGYYYGVAGGDTLTSIVVKLKENGNFDPAFGNNGRVVIKDPSGWFTGDSPVLRDVEIQHNGRILLVYASEGSYSDFGFRFLKPNGQIDFGYQEINWAYTEDEDELLRNVVVLPDDKILVGGVSNSGNSLLERFDVSSFFDDSFGNGGIMQTGFSKSLRNMIVLPDGKIVEMGYPLYTRFSLARYLPDGQVDPTFGNGGKIAYDSMLYHTFYPGMALSPDQKIVITGGNRAYASYNQEATIGRFLSDGKVDSTFGFKGRAYLPYSQIGVYAEFSDVKVLPDRRILACGSTNDSPYKTLMARFLPEGGAKVWYQDADGDGYGTAQDSVYAALQPTGYSSHAGDCNDQNPEVHPGATDWCDNNIDENCDGVPAADHTPPIAHCISTLTLFLNEQGIATLNAEDLNDESSDDCDETLSYSTPQTIFTLIDLGTQPETLIVTNSAQLSGSCNCIVTVVDTIPPIARCIDSLTLVLSPGGPTYVFPFDIDNGSSDNTGIQHYLLTPDQFTVNDLGYNEVTLTVTDFAGLTDVCHTTVLVINPNTGVQNLDSEQLVHVFPNPGSGLFEIQSLGNEWIERLEVFDSTGRLIWSESGSAKRRQIDLSNAAGGVYWVCIYAGPRKQMTKLTLVR